MTMRQQHFNRMTKNLTLRT